MEPAVRWDALFTDLAAQAEVLGRADREQEIAERSRIEYGSVSLAARLAGSRGRLARVQTVAGTTVAGRIDQVGSDWLLMLGEGGRESLVALAAVQAVRGLNRSSAPMPTSTVDNRLGIRSTLRGIARQRALVTVDVRDGSTLIGTIDRVGADLLDLTSRPPGDLLRGGESVAVALAAVVAVRRSAG